MEEMEKIFSSTWLETLRKGISCCVQTLITHTFRFVYIHLDFSMKWMWNEGDGGGGAGGSMAKQIYNACSIREAEHICRLVLWHTTDMGYMNGWTSLAASNWNEAHFPSSGVESYD